MVFFTEFSQFEVFLCKVFVRLWPPDCVNVIFDCFNYANDISMAHGVDFITYIELHYFLLLLVGNKLLFIKTHLFFLLYILNRFLKIAYTECTEKPIESTTTESIVRGQNTVIVMIICPSDTSSSLSKSRNRWYSDRRV